MSFGKVVAPFLLLAVLAAGTALAAPVVLDRLEASVNSSLILLSDVKKFRETVKLRQQLDPIFAGTAVASKGDGAPPNEIVEFLIDERLITQAFPVNDTEAEQQINTIQSNNHIDRPTLKKTLEDQGFAFEDYFELIRSSASKMNLIDRDIRPKVSVSDDDVKNYFYNHYIKDKSTPMSYRLLIISVSPKNYKTPADARETAQRALKDIRGGEGFEEVAKRVSDDGSAQAGGDLGVLTEDQMSPAIREQVKKLQIGQVSDVFGSSETGFFVIKLSDLQTGESDRLAKLSNEIRSQLTAAEYRHQIELWIDRTRQTAFIHRAGESSTAGLPTAPSHP
jgi:parvulin-like peptidyl-prolyl isomerase